MLRGTDQLPTTLIANFYVGDDEALFGFGNGILDDYNVNLRFFFQSGKRYTPAVFTGSYEVDGRPQYDFVRGERYTAIADDWFYIDLNFEKISENRAV